MNKTLDEDDMTPEERLQWLKDRGVLVETAEERKAKLVEKTNQDLDANYESLKPDERRVKYVVIPADSSKPLQELSMISKGSSGNVDLLQDRLKSVFSCSSSDTINMDLLNEQAAKQFGTSNTPIVTDASLRSVASQGSVEVFRLVPPMESNKYYMINFYLDEIGLMKNLSLNARASQFALKAGFNPPPNFYGDIFIGRLQVRKILNSRFRFKGY